MNPACFTALESLHLENIVFVDAQDLITFLNMLKSLKYLTFTSVKITKLEENDFKCLHLPSLESVIFKNCLFNLEMVSNLRAISHLELLDCQYYHSQLKKTIQHLSNLKRLGITSSASELNTNKNYDDAVSTLKKKFPHLSVSIKQSDKKTTTEKVSKAKNDLNGQTSEEDKIFRPVQYFIPKDKNPISTAHYRLMVHHKPASITAKDQINFDYMDCIVTKMTDDEMEIIRSSDNLKKLYLDIYHQTEDIHYGLCPLLIASDKWTAIPSLSPNETLLKIKCKAKFIVGYCKEKNLFMIKLQENQPTDEYNVEIIIDARFYHLEPISNWQKHTYSQIGNSILNHIEFSLTQNRKIEINRASVQKAFNDSYGDYDHFLRCMKRMAENSLLNVNTDDMEISNHSFEIIVYGFTEIFNQFGKGELLGPKDKAVDLLSTLIKERKGACRHRAALFKILVDILLAESKTCLTYSTPHAFIEITRGGMSPWYRIDLGGYPAKVENQPTFKQRHSGPQNQSRSSKRISTTMDGDTTYIEPAMQANADIGADQDALMSHLQNGDEEDKKEKGLSKEFFFDSDSDSDDDLAEEKVS